MPCEESLGVIIFRHAPSKNFGSVMDMTGSYRNSDPCNPELGLYAKARGVAKPPHHRLPLPDARITRPQARYARSSDDLTNEWPRWAKGLAETEHTGREARPMRRNT